MVANLGLVLFGVSSIFVLFMVGLACGTWMTRKIDLKS